MTSGFLLINKKPGLTSYDVIRRLKKITGIKKIGHSGVLDRFAQGLLIVGVGKKATKNLAKFLKADKEYIGIIKLGETSTTYDPEGVITPYKIEEIPSLSKIKKVLKSFQGEITQIPPIYSNKKIKGKRASDLVREGKEVELPPQKVKIYQIKLIKYEYPKLVIKINCSSGTYIRSLANEIGEKLKTGAYLTKLIRTKIGNISLKEAVFLENLNSQNWQSYLKEL